MWASGPSVTCEVSKSQGFNCVRDLIGNYCRFTGISNSKISVEISVKCIRDFELMADLSGVGTRPVHFLMYNCTDAPIGRCSRIILLCLCAAVSVVLWNLIFNRQQQGFEIRTATQSVAMPFAPDWTVPLRLRCRDQLDDNVATQVLSREVIVRHVYFDPRPRNGYYNTTVFLMEAKGSHLPKERFSGCRVGQYTSKEVYLRSLKKNNGTLTLVECYNVPGVVRNGDSAFLFYNISTHLTVQVSSLKPLFLPEPGSAHKPPSATVVMCVGMIRLGNHTPSEHGMLYHWLRYHKVVGVDHVHMFTQNNFVMDGGLQNEVVKQALREGYLSIDFWPKWLSFKEVKGVKNSQILAYQDCLNRFRGVYDYAVYADSDDFFVPVKKNTSIKYYLKTWCSGKTSTCKFTWRQYFPSCGWNPDFIEPNGNVTGAVTYKKTYDHKYPKSAHQLRAILKVGVHNPKDVQKGYRAPRHSVPPQEAYFAHIRFGKGKC